MNIVRFNKAECNMLQAGGCNLRYVYSLREELTESSPVEKHLGVLVDEKLNMRCSPEGQLSLAASTEGWQQGEGENCPSLLFPQRCSEGWSTSPTKKDSGSWACSAWRREGSGKTSLWPTST